MIKLKIPYLLFLSFFLSPILSVHESFSNECGTYTGEVEENPSSEECIGATTGVSDSSIKCCYIEGEKDLKKKTACILVTDTQEKRIEAITEMTSIATGVKLNCGSQKEFPSDCGSDNPSSISDCTKDHLSDGYDCCFINVESEQYTGKGCKKYKNIDINTIGEAVVAARTVGAKLTVDCFDFTYYHIHFGIFFIWILAF